eukprot:CAMPEP_0172764586 /NCGR_PEP_ID=MMETSP1074-20121228/177522_1 /TAXON_ID=2916 /ORGANISM="Ceratium fusus, Strain PA161109" /LENGTH=48 /DNA_ID= /DNA_START= /DNA_END= /DNA_ORIENTATION=
MARHPGSFRLTDKTPRLVGSVLVVKLTMPKLDKLGFAVVATHINALAA